MKIKDLYRILIYGKERFLWDLICELKIYTVFWKKLKISTVSYMEIKDFYSISWKIETCDIFYLMIFLLFSGDGGWRFLGEGGRLDRGRGHSGSGVGRSASDSFQWLSKGETIPRTSKQNWARTSIFCDSWRAG